MKGFRLPEWVKNLLIVLLSCSALYLFTLTPLYLNSPLRDWTAQLLDRGQSETANPLSLAAVLQPARIAIRNASGCYGGAASPSGSFATTPMPRPARCWKLRSARPRPRSWWPRTAGGRH